MTDHEVLVVGYGPVGAVLANLLGQAGIDALVVDPTLDVFHLPRAAHFDDEVMRTFQHLGLADAVLPATTPVLGMDFVTATGEVLFGFGSADRPRRHGWEAGYMFFQPDLERAVRAGVERFASVRVELGHEAVAFRPGAEHVEVDVRDVASGAVRTVTARYVVGCDGARSSVRRAMGVELDDLGFDQPWLVVDTVLRPDASVELPERVQQICDPARPATFVPSAGAHRRWELMAMGDETADELLAPATVERLLSPWVRVGRDVDVLRTAVYSFHALIARRWRDGRMVLAGDAAHQMPPFLGQGMCAGIRDAANLAWKLELVLRAGAPDALLDTYQPERAPHVRAITELAVALGGILQTTDPVVAAERDAAFRADGSTPPPAGLPPLGRSALAVGEGPSVGRPLPQHRVGDDDALGRGFAIVGPLAAEAPDVGAPTVRVVRPEGPTLVVRPDRYVAAEATTSAELVSAVEQVAAVLTPRVAAAPG